MVQIHSEIEMLLAAFPDLRDGRARPSGPRFTDDGQTIGRPRRRKRGTMSAAARKAVSERMRKYWAKRRAAKKAA